MIYKILYIIIFFFFGFANVNAASAIVDTCKYKNKIKTCINANLNNSERSISDFTCVEGNNSVIAAQIILDDKFKEIDKKIEEYVSNLIESKDLCFGVDKKKNYTECVDEIHTLLSPNSSSGSAFVKQYNDVCDNQILAETIACNGGFIDNIKAKEYINGNSGYCKSLARTKLYVYETLSYNTLKYNKVQILKDANKKFIQIQRTKYEKLIDLININLGFLQRMLSKWPNKTQNCN